MDHKVWLGQDQVYGRVYGPPPLFFVTAILLTEESSILDRYVGIPSSGGILLLPNRSRQIIVRRLRSLSR